MVINIREYERNPRMERNERQTLLTSRGGDSGYHFSQWWRSAPSDIRFGHYCNFW